MHLAFLSEFDPEGLELHRVPRSKLGHWGRCVAMAAAIEQAGHTVSRIGGLNKTAEMRSRRAKLKRRGYKLLRQTYLAWAEPEFNRSYAQQLAQKLAQLGQVNPTPIDAILTPDLNLIAHLNTSIPCFFWADTTYANLIDFYPEFTHLCRESRQQLQALDQLGLSRCQGVLLASRWAKNETITAYDLDPRTVTEVPLGANLNPSPAFDLENALALRSHTHLRLLWMGTDWQRKGGDFAVELATKLNRIGISTQLVVVGLTTQDLQREYPNGVPKVIQTHGVLNPREPDQQRHLELLFSQAHFLLLPSEAECFGHVLCEANGFGVPTIASDVGGIPSVVRSGLNGYTYPRALWVTASVNQIRTLWRDRAAYEALARSARLEYATRLNWASAGQKAAAFIGERLAIGSC